MSEANKALVRRFLDALSNNDQLVLDEVLAPEFVIHVPGAPGPVNREMHAQGIGALTSAFGGFAVTIEDQIVEGDTVVTRITWRGSHDGDFQGSPPTGKQVSVSAMDIARCGEGKIVERWFLQDSMGLMQQLGALPSPGGS